jgi:hypothetical protein
MHLDPSSPYALVLAHGDDEIGAIPFILKNPPLLVLYLTDGRGIGEKSHSATRYVEIEHSWHIISEKVRIVHFGFDLGIPDGSLHSQFTPDHLAELISLLTNSGVENLVTTYAEGGHQDHDTVFMISQFLSSKLGLGILSFSLYRQSLISRKLFVVMKESGAGERIEICDTKIRIKTLLKAMRVMFNYKSQLKTWIGLGAPILFSYMRKFVLSIPKWVSLADYPDSGKLYYESRGHADRVEVIRSWSKLGII